MSSNKKTPAKAADSKKPSNKKAPSTKKPVKKTASSKKAESESGHSKKVAAKKTRKATTSVTSKATKQATKQATKKATKQATNTKAAKPSQATKASEKKAFVSANAITVIRILLAFVWLALFEIVTEPPLVVAATTTRFAEFSVPTFIFTIAFLVIAFTDFLDGYFARKSNTVSSFGIFLDPIADKILVLCGLLVLMQYGYVNIWAVVIIVSREFIVSGMRMCVAKNGVVVPANGVGKAKTALTMASILGFLLYMSLPPLLLGAIVIFWISQILLLLAIFFTIWSGLEYYAENKSYL